MIKFTFSIQNPWSKDSPHHTYFYYYRKLSKNKTFETQLYKSSPYDIFKLYLSLAWTGEDHAGPELEINLGKYNFVVKIYDHRHWNWGKGRFKTDEEVAAEYEEYAESLNK